MAFIGTLEFIRLDWSRQPQGEAVRRIERPGGDGVAYQSLGKRSRPTRAIAVVDVTDAAAVDTLVQAANTYRGSLQTVVEDDGTSTDDVMVLNVTKLEARFVLTPVGGINGGNWIVRLEFVLQETVV